MSSLHPLIEQDIRAVLKRIQPLLEELRDQKLFITGGTGFFGQWILDSIVLANEIFGLNIQVTVLTRSLTKFTRESPGLVQNPALTFVEGDIQSFEYPEGRFSYVIHAATTRAEETFQGEDPLRKYDTIAAGTRHLLDFAVQAKTNKLLWTSSGALYGAQPEELTAIPESYVGAPDPMSPAAAALGLGKRVAEFQCAYYAEKYGIEIKIARCFAFLGPRMQMDIHYAIGNFIMDVVSGRSIVVNSDGRPQRSYMYISDLVEWLWTILLKGEALKPYNVGSDDALTIGELAKKVSNLGNNGTTVEIKGVSSAGGSTNRYIPSIKFARDSLQLDLHVNLDEAILRCIEYERSRISPSASP